MRVDMGHLNFHKASSLFSRAASVAEAREARNAPAARRDSVSINGQKDQKPKKDGMLSFMQEQISTLKSRRTDLMAQASSLPNDEFRDLKMSLIRDQIKEIDTQLSDLNEQITQHILDKQTEAAEKETEEKKSGGEKTADDLEADQISAIVDSRGKVEMTEQLMSNKTSMEARASELAIAQRNDAGFLTTSGPPRSRTLDRTKLAAGIHATDQQAAKVTEFTQERTEDIAELGRAKAEAEAIDQANAAEREAKPESNSGDGVIAPDASGNPPASEDGQAATTETAGAAPAASSATIRGSLTPTELAVERAKDRDTTVVTGQVLASEVAAVTSSSVSTAQPAV